MGIEELDDDGRSIKLGHIALVIRVLRRRRPVMCNHRIKDMAHQSPAVPRYGRVRRVVSQLLRLGIRAQSVVQGPALHPPGDVRKTLASPLVALVAGCCILATVELDHGDVVSAGRAGDIELEGRLARLGVGVEGA